MAISRRSHVSRYQNTSILDFIASWMTEAVVTTGATICANVKSSPTTYQHRTLYRLDALPVTQGENSPAVWPT